MSRPAKFFLVLTIVAFVSTLLILSSAASAANPVPVIIGSTDSFSRYPIGLETGVDSTSFPNFQAGGTYQQVYAGSSFAGPVTITQIAFASSSQLTSGPGTVTYNFNINLSTTAAGPNGLSTNLAANRGADFAQVFSGVKTATLTANNQFDVVIPVTPFNYDPAHGNLLMEIDFNAPVQFTGGSVLYFTAGNSSSSSRAANPAGVAGGAFTDGFGLRTQFATTSVGTAQVTLGNLVQTFDGSPKTVSVSTDPADLNVAVTYDGSATAPTNAGSYAVSAVVNDASFHGQANGTLTIQPASQQITFGALPNKTIGDTDFGVSATASSNLPVSFAANGNCALNGTQVHLIGAGLCTITASQDGNANINPAAPVARTFSIGKSDQQIIFEALVDKQFGDADFAVSATASSNLIVSFSAGGNCTVNGSQVHLTGAGSCTITASQDGNSNNNAAAPVARSFPIAKANQQITFDALANKTVGDADFGVSATASSNLAVSFSATGNCTLNGNQIRLTGAGQCEVTASQDGDANTNAATPVSRTFSIGKLNQQITFDALANKTVGDTDFGVSATASSNLIINFAAGGNCTVSGNQVHLTGAGTCTITASQDGDANTNAATPVSRTFSIGKLNQQITFDALPNKTAGDADFGVSATASSTLAVAFSAVGNCSVNVTQVHLTRAGQCTIKASQDGDANTNAAAPIARTFSIGKADQQITFDALADKKFGDADFNLTAIASSNLVVSLAPTGNCTLIGAQVHLTGAGQCTITASQNGDANVNAAPPVTRTFSISKADQQITFEALANKTAGDLDFGINATASSNLPVAFSAEGNCTATGAQVHLTAAGVCTITASQDGNANVNAATPVVRTFSIGKANQQIAFDALADKKFADADFDISATASSNLAVTLTAAGNCILNGNQLHITGAGQCTITASQGGDANTNPAAQVVRTFSIGKADQQITFDALANKTIGDADFVISAAATSNLAVAFSAGGNCALNGNQVHMTGAGQCTITASQDGDANVNAAAPVARTFTISKADQLITFDALADRKFGDADFTVVAGASSKLKVTLSAAGNCALNENQIHLTGAGQCTITASQDGDADTNAAKPVARTFSIGKADQQIAFSALPDKNFGDPDFTVSATASSSLAVSLAATGNCTSNGSQLHLTGAGQCTVTASQEGDSNYNPATAVARTFTIGKAEQQITFAGLPNKAVGDADFNVSATASSNLAVSFAASGACTITGTQVHLTGAGQCTITASQDGDANTNAATPVARAFSIGKTDQQITFDALADKKFGDADFNISATASSNLAVGLAADGNCTLNGTQVHLTGAGPCTITASQDGDANINAAAPVRRNFAIAKADQQITFDALTDKKVDDPDFDVSAKASSNLTVSFAATGNCTVSGSQVHLTGAGQCTITASQDGNADYNPAAAVTRSFTIAAQPTTQTLINFVSSSFQVGENAGTVAITVKRSGDTSGLSTVDYATDDTGAPADCGRSNGIAASRCDFNAAIGTLTFSPGDTEKSFRVVINRDSRVEMPFESFTVKLSSPTGGAALGDTSSASVQINDVSGGLPPDFNVIDDTRTFVRQQYHDFLNREPDQQGLDFWTDNIDKCNRDERRPAGLTVAQCKELMRINTSAAFFLSIEFQETGNLVRSFYVAALDRPLTNDMPEFAEFERDSQAMQLGVIVGQENWRQILNDNRDVFMKDFVTRTEFEGLYPTTDTPTQYVDKLYLHAGITPDLSERSDAIAEFGSAAAANDAGARGRALLRVTQNNSFQKREVTRSFVQMQYLGYLQRNPNDLPDSNFDGYEFWLQKLNRFNGDFVAAEMVKAFLASREYRARFGP